jgi:NAD(P)-dependent dehydrogenase (short-subunit alcohol dehydrogenase family)
VLVIASADAEQPAYSQTDCSNPPIPWADVQKQFWEAGYAIVTPCAFAGESELLNAVHDYALTGCKWAQAVRAGRNYPAKPGTCPRKSNKWKSVAAIHDAAVSEETRRMLAYLHDTQELPFPYQTVTRVHPAIIRAHSDVIFWDTFPRAHTAGSWLALEDIHPDSGPLEIYPKSHRESLWDEYELGLPTAAEAIKAAIAASSPPPSSNDRPRRRHGASKRGGFLSARPHAAISVPNLSELGPPSQSMPNYHTVLEKLFSNRTTVAPFLKRGQMLLWASSLVHLSRPPRNYSLSRSSFISHYMWNTKAYWQPWVSQKDITYVKKKTVQIPVTPKKTWAQSSSHAGMAAQNPVAAKGAAAVATAENEAKVARRNVKETKRKAERTPRNNAGRSLHKVNPAESTVLDREIAPPVADAIVSANRAAKKCVFIVGASRGVGLGLAKVYAASGYAVHATTRTLNEPGELGKLPGVQLHQLDVLVPSDIAALRAKADAGALGAISTYIHNAAVKNQNLTHNMLVNAKAPFDVAEALLPAVLLSDERKLCIITSDMGSNELMSQQKASRQKWPYTISKKAANKAFREREPEWRTKGITAVVMNPGYVKTHMSGGFGNLTPLESAASIKRTIDRIAPVDAGKFFDHDGKVLPW